ncbi:UDP-N-acetylmuramoyl-L-alanyl-D-glutamate--2,6-diaminopimelate ligase [bacterium]|nr:UDP-N-acetylmuramoyl-L-alanyl-D-glutamate--2,6-diaminopimelate ligase [bacterium]
MKNLTELAGSVVGASVHGAAEVSDICYDSRKAKPGDLFVCVRGLASDGHKFAADAVAKGAVALVVEEPVAGVDVPYIQVPDGRRALALIAAAFYDHPADKLLNIGITGTNGKTTTAFLTSAVLQSLGKNPGLLGTIEARIGDKTLQLPNTTPESMDLQRYLSEMRQCDQDAVVMEVSSHALALDRVLGIPYDIAVFTNLTQDHLDFHANMDEYFAEKSKLFLGLGTHKGRPAGPYAVINIDDEYGRKLYELVRYRVPVITYGTDKNADVRAFNVIATPNGLSFIVETRMEACQVELPMSGAFNVYNCLAAISVGIALRGELSAIVAGVEAVSLVPGRFQLVREGQPFTVIVDYAHTPDGLQNVLKSAREITSGELTVVFGCGGDRDRGKRPIMGRIAADLADKLVITSDNPRSESAEDIIEQIMEGVRSSAATPKVLINADRGEAIALAIAEAKDGDTIVVAGKGHEKYQKFKDRTIHFDDVERARECLRKRDYQLMLNKAVPSVRLHFVWDRSVLRTDNEILDCLEKQKRDAV